MPRFRRPVLLVGLLALLTDTACYAYQPAAGTPRPGGGVRFALTEGGTAELAKYLGPNVQEVTGQLGDVLPSGVLVVTPQWVKTSSGVLQPWSGEGAVDFPRDYVRSLDQRTFSRRRTTIAVVAVTSGVIAIAMIALKTGGAHGDAAPGGGTPTR